MLVLTELPRKAMGEVQKAALRTELCQADR